MKREGYSKCCSCRRVFLSPLILDCGHAICQQCLSEVLREEEKQEQLKDDLEIECAGCSYLTSLAIPLAYKAVRAVRETEASKHSQHCKSMVCMDCLDGCIPIEQYLKGEHSSHHVLPLVQAYAKIKDLLFYQEKELQEAVNKLYLQNQKYLHLKSLLNDVYNGNVIKIKTAFENMREEIARKEAEALDYYEQRIHKYFSSIDQDIADNKKSIELCQHHLSYISDTLPDELNHLVTNQAIFSTVHYFIQNHAKIDNLCELSSSHHISAAMEEVEENRRIVDLEQSRKIEKSIRMMEVFRDDASTAASTCTLSREYFDHKRREVFSSTQQEPHFLRKTDFFHSMKKLQALKENTKSDHFKKVDEVKHKLKRSHFNLG